MNEPRMDTPSVTVPPAVVPAAPRLPHNRLGIDYRKVPPRKVSVPGGIVDAHTHTREVALTRVMVQAAEAYGITEFWTMAPLEHAASLREAFPGKFRFVAIPAWQRHMTTAPGDDFFADWKRRLSGFAELGARFAKFHAAPGTCRKWGVTLDDPRIQSVAREAYALGYHFMTHVGDPKAWFFDTGNYADGSYGTFEAQFAMLERMLEAYPDRLHLGAHMGGSLEALEALARRMERYPHYILDTSATKWMIRAVAEQSPSAVRDFFIAFQDRILFGSDVVVGDKYDWDHYASRFWSLQQLWERGHVGESPIEDPDAGRGFVPLTGGFDESRATGVPALVGVDLPAGVLRKIYRDNALRWWPAAGKTPPRNQP